ncbi:MAG: 50S ribosomal protein L18 [Planctomycetota bacterium]|nr:MAG: 50S ribosomal protein L18 [Planctomycetota bacterium]
MSITKNLHRSRQRRTWRVRNQVRRFAGGRLRLSVFRSNKHISAQVIDDASGKTVASASSSEKELREQLKNGGNVEAATVVGKKLGERCVQQGITEVVFDRGQYKYHGRVAALADGAREAGLQF